MKHTHNSPRLLSFSCIAAVAIATFGHAQQDDFSQSGTSAFASENAILDTAIPFAIGAREAQQSLRGSFGWPTFQEGLVQGVYFRFDPDGYARFAPTPRLDTDVFEVICRPRTYSCMGRKGTMSILLNSRGQLQMKIDDVQAGDRFFVSEGVSEIEVPDRILQPLDTQMEVLLSTGGDLIVRRGENEKDRISLTGFYPVSAYLRWVTARQDYTILPRGWPVPNAGNDQSGLTQSSSWQSPMPQPQNLSGLQVGYQAQQVTQATTPQLQIQPTANPNITAQYETNAEVAEVKGELKVLRELLLQRSEVAAQQNATNQTSQSALVQAAANLQRPNDSVSSQINSLQAAAQQIQNDLARLTQSNNGIANMPNQNGMHLPPSTLPVPAQNPVPNERHQKAVETAQRLQYLMTEIGLDAKTAMMLIQANDPSASAMPSSHDANTSVRVQETPSMTTRPISQPPVFRENVVAQILKELEQDLQPEPANTQDMVDRNLSPSDPDYQLLSRYFKSVALFDQ